ncbi:MAG: phytanoyl-CoA dioxygenase family protein [Gaiellaceae bacterium]
MSVASVIRGQLARRAPGLEERAARAAWRLRNRDRSVSGEALDPGLSGLAERLRRDGVVLGSFEELIGDADLFTQAAAQADRLYAQPREAPEGGEGKASFLTKLATGSYVADDPFVRIALHPNVLAVANAYLRLRSTLRSLDLWLTAPTPGPAIETQLWHRDADDVMNVKLFVYFTDVTRAAGPLCYAPGSHPLGPHRELPERDDRGRSTDEQLARIVPERDWILCEGKRGTVVLADTCGYHKQLKPAGEERVLLVAHYVSGTPFVPRVLELEGVDEAALTDDQYVAVHDRPRE